MKIKIIHISSLNQIWCTLWQRTNLTFISKIRANSMNANCANNIVILSTLFKLQSWLNSGYTYHALHRNIQLLQVKEGKYLDIYLGKNLAHVDMFYKEKIIDRLWNKLSWKLSKIFVSVSIGNVVWNCNTEVLFS